MPIAATNSAALDVELQKKFVKKKTPSQKDNQSKSEIKNSQRNEDIKNISAAETDTSFSALKPQINTEKKYDGKQKDFAEKLLKALKSEPAKLIKQILMGAPAIGLFSFFDSSKPMSEKMSTMLQLSAVAAAPFAADAALVPILEKAVPDKNDNSFNPDTDMIFPNEEFRQTLFNGVARFLEATDTSGVSLNLDKLKKKSPTMLFTGPPGVGKTEIGKYVAKKMNKKLKFVSASELSAFVGGTENNIIKAFEEAKRNNMLLFFDEADTFVSQRSETPMSGSAKHDNNVVNTILKQIDESGIPCIFATNSGNIDKALKDRMKVTIGFPEATPAQNYGILLRQLMKLEMKQEHFKDFIQNQDKLIKVLADASFSPRDMHNVVEEAVEIVSQRVSAAARKGTSCP